MEFGPNSLVALREDFDQFLLKFSILFLLYIISSSTFSQVAVVAFFSNLADVGHHASIMVSLLIQGSNLGQLLSTFSYNFIQLIRFTFK